ncbi:hypothetical protein NQ318_004255 [Aromia moschata]|uniref:Folylpolyglutamate synthase n=1 Tax=Aromia moschata TaxID=1265417 RepID=A0AAV8XS08_9CUCU|nr:hypothetical protein NQ318_004255 [Aromia moschata]
MVFPRSLRVNSLRSLATATQNMLKQARSYQDAIEALNKLQTNQQYIKNASAKPKAETNIAEVTKFLTRTGLSLETLDKLPIIHIAGTNGKGFTCAYCENILRNHGYKTGFYSSPHLLDVRERIRINGKPISKNDFVTYFWRLYDMLDSQKTDPHDMPLYFRYMTILALHVFIEHKVDVAILEVGIGGEFDCTNVVRNTIVAGITPLDFDHTSLLGASLESIAWNKGGIMKEGCLAFTTEQPEDAMNVLQKRSVERKCTLKIVDKNYHTGNHNMRVPSHIQKTNASLALAITEAFIDKTTTNNNQRKHFSLDLAKKSIGQTHWPGDGAHTSESMTICTNWFKEKTEDLNRKKGLIFNLTGDRNPEVFFKELSKLKFDVVIFTPNVGSNKDPIDNTDYVLSMNHQIQRCQGYKKKWLEIVGDSQEKSNVVKVIPFFSSAVNFLESEGECDVLVTGSIHLIGAAMSVLDPTLNGLLAE